MTSLVIPFPHARIVRAKAKADDKPVRSYRCECGSMMWHLRTSGAVECASCNREVTLVVRPFFLEPQA